MEKIEFSEKQPFSHPWIWALLLPIIFFLVYGIFQQLILDKPFGINPAPDYLLVIFALIPAGILLLLLRAYLKTEISHEALTYKFFPFHLRQHRIAWRDVSRAYIRTYKPIREFGGWGIRISVKNGIAYNVMRDHKTGLQLHLESGKKILFSTQKPEELAAILKSLGFEGKQDNLGN